MPRRASCVAGAPLRSKPTREQQHDKNDHDDAKDANAPMTIAIAVAAEAAAEAADQEDDQDDDEYESNRHDLSPLPGPGRLFCVSPACTSRAPECREDPGRISPAGVSVNRGVRASRGDDK